jgi:hypothetical protein
MKIGNVSQEVTVTEASGAVALQTDSHELSTSVDSRELNQLPNSGQKSPKHGYSWSSLAERFFGQCC